jgi:hypothetical protein
MPLLLNLKPRLLICSVLPMLWLVSCAQGDDEPESRILTRDLRTSSDLDRTKNKDNEPTKSDGSSPTGHAIEKSSSNSKAVATLPTQPTTPVEFKATSIVNGFDWLKRSTNANKAFRATTDKFSPLTGTTAEKIAAVLYTGVTPTSDQLVSDIRNWNWRPKNCGLETEQEQRGELVDVTLQDCFSPNKYGIQNCPNPTEEFLGVRDISGFKSAFGVRVSCKGTVPYNLQRYKVDNGELYHTVREIWLHADSNHPYRVVAEGVAVFKKSNASLSLKDALASTVDVLIHFAQFKNYTPASSGPIKDIFSSYQLSSDRARFPGRYFGRTYCFAFRNEPNKIGFVSFASLLIMGIKSESEPVLYYLNGSWIGNQDRGGGVFSGGRFRNITANMSLVGPLNVTYRSTDSPKFSEVSVNNTSPIKLIDQGYYNAGSVSDFLKPVFCFVFNPDNQVKGSLDRHLEVL